MFKNKMSDFIRKFKRVINTALGRDYCPFCDCWSSFRPFGLVPRGHAQCPYCGSLERHRFLLNVYQKHIFSSSASCRLLHTAPEEVLVPVFVQKENIEYVPIDLTPELFPFVPCVRADVTELPFEDASFDWIISNHVLEHIEDEEKCLAEISRVLKPSGSALLTFPVNWEAEETFEDPAIQSPEERLKFYGQEDHVRAYGKDAVKRLERFFDVKLLTGSDFPVSQNQRWGNFSYCFWLKNKQKDR